MKEYELVVGGHWRQSPEIANVYSPYSGETVGRVCLAKRSDIDDAAELAVRGFGITRRLSSHARSRILEGLAAEVRKRSEELARLLVAEGGKTISFARSEVARAVSTLEVSAEEARRIGGELIPLDWSADSEGRFAITRRFPVGPVLGIVPFNFPLNLACHKLGPAIAAGNPIILKPATATPLSALVLAEMVLDAGFPPEALSVLPCPGERIEPLCADDRIALLSFTGSSEVGWHLREIAGRKKVCLELGGNAAAIVHGDAHVAYAAKRIVTGGFTNAGQVCISVQRVLLCSDIYEEALEMILSGVGALRCGDPSDEKTDVGPMITAAAAERAYRKVEEAVSSGAEVLAGGKPPDGTLFSPTVLAGTTPEMRVNREEVFAPVITVTAYDDFHEAVRIANQSEFGLQVGVFTRDIGRALYAFEHADVGGVQLNDIPTFRVDHMPYGGVKRSGTGREGPRYAIEEMTELKLLGINRPGGTE